MKTQKTASGKQTIKISKSEWNSIGKKAGWMKKAEEIDYEKIRQEMTLDKHNKNQSGYRKAVIHEACATCKNVTTKNGLYSCAKYGFNVSLTNICNDYDKDASKEPYQL